MLYKILALSLSPSNGKHVTKDGLVMNDQDPWSGGDYSKECTGYSTAIAMCHNILEIGILVAFPTKVVLQKCNKYMLLRNFRYCSVDVKCMLFRSYCTNMYCCPL